jgi:hypothetical protein
MGVVILSYLEIKSYYYHELFTYSIEFGKNRFVRLTKTGVLNTSFFSKFLEKPCIKNPLLGGITPGRGFFGFSVSPIYLGLGFAKVVLSSFLFC